MFGLSPESSNYHSILRHYSTLYSQDVTEFGCGLANFFVPIIPEKIFQSLCKTITFLFQREPSLLKLDIDCIIIGDLHGHILDLLRILKKFGPPPNRNYLFLGDTIDRGEFSLETIQLIFVMKALYPQNIFIIRGNHEFPDLCETGGFGFELKDVYQNSYQNLATTIYETFSYMPIGAIISNKILCIHGGIGPSVHSIKDISNIQRPLTNYEIEPVQSLLWSDPNPEISEFADSPRGLGYRYGQDALMKFLRDNNLELLVRGHECVDGGINMFFQRRLVTVFSASNYCGVSPNKAAVLSISMNGQKKEATVFTPLRYFTRPKAIFVKSEKENMFIITKKTLEAAIPKPMLPNLTVHIDPIPQHSKSQISRSTFSKTTKKTRPISEQSPHKTSDKPPVGLTVDRRAYSDVFYHTRDHSMPRQKSVRKFVQTRR